MANQTASAAGTNGPTTYLGFDVAHYPQAPTMTTFRTAGFTIVGLYLAHSPAHPANDWIAVARSLADDGWGVVPIYVGRQIVDPHGHPVPPPADPQGDGALDGRQAVALAGQAGLAPGRTLYLDIEGKAVPSGAFESYLLAWVQAVKGAGYKTAVYCHHGVQTWAAAHGLPFWTVNLNGQSGSANAYCNLTAPLPVDPMDANAVGTQARFFCTLDNGTTVFDYDAFSVPDPSRL